MLQTIRIVALVSALAFSVLGAACAVSAGVSSGGASGPGTVPKMGGGGY